MVNIYLLTVCKSNLPYGQWVCEM